MGKKVLVVWLCAIAAAFRTRPRVQSSKTKKPLPDIPALMHAAERRSRERPEAIEKNYLYHSMADCQRKRWTRRRPRRPRRESMTCSGLRGVPVRRLVKRNGKELSPDEQKKESEKIDKEAEKAREKRDRADAEGERKRSSRASGRLPSRGFWKFGKFFKSAPSGRAGRTGHDHGGLHRRSEGEDEKP